MEAVEAMVEAVAEAVTTTVEVMVVNYHLSLYRNSLRSVD